MESCDLGMEKSNAGICSPVVDLERLENKTFAGERVGGGRPFGNLVLGDMVSLLVPNGDLKGKKVLESPVMVGKELVLLFPKIDIGGMIVLDHWVLDRADGLMVTDPNGDDIGVAEWSVNGGSPCLLEGENEKEASATFGSSLVEMAPECPLEVPAGGTELAEIFCFWSSVYSVFVSLMKGGYVQLLDFAADFSESPLSGVSESVCFRDPNKKRRRRRIRG